MKERRLVTSEQIIATFVKKADGSLELKIKGRGPTNLSGKSQGDHVTAHALIERGASRIFTKRGGTTFSSKKDSNYHFRQKRDQLIHYMSHIVSIDDDASGIVLNQIKEIKENYDNSRFSKTELSEVQNRYSNDKNLQSIFEKCYLANYKYMCDEVEQYSKLLLTQYNQIPNISYKRIPKLTSNPSEGSQVLTSLNYLEEASRNPRSQNPQLVAYHLQRLFFYPPIPNNKIQEANKVERSNDPEKLYSAISKHLFIAAKSYPELCGADKMLDKGIIKSFIGNIKKLWTKTKHNKAFVDLSLAEENILHNLKYLEEKSEDFKKEIDKKIIEHGSSTEQTPDSSPKPQTRSLSRTHKRKEVPGPNVTKPMTDNKKQKYQE